MYTFLFFIRKKDYSRKKKKDLIKSNKIIINSTFPLHFLI